MWSSPGERRASQGGQSLVELALALPVLLFFLIGVIEFGNAITVTHTMTGFAREGANLAARGTPLDTVLAVIGEEGEELDLATHGGAVVSRIQIDKGTPIVREQVTSQGYADASRIGGPDEESLPLSGLGLVDGETYWVVEIFYDYDPIGPLDRALQAVTPGTLYRWSLF